MHPSVLPRGTEAALRLRRGAEGLTQGRFQLWGHSTTTISREDSVIKAGVT